MVLWGFDILFSKLSVLGFGDPAIRLFLEGTLSSWIRCDRGQHPTLSSWISNDRRQHPTPSSWRSNDRKQPLPILSYRSGQPSTLLLCIVGVFGSHCAPPLKFGGRPCRALQCKKVATPKFKGRGPTLRRGCLTNRL